MINAATGTSNKFLIRSQIESASAIDTDVKTLLMKFSPHRVVKIRQVFRALYQSDYQNSEVAKKVKAEHVVDVLIVPKGKELKVELGQKDNSFNMIICFGSIFLKGKKSSKRNPTCQYLIHSSNDSSPVSLSGCLNLNVDQELVVCEQAFFSTLEHVDKELQNLYFNKVIKSKSEIRKKDSIAKMLCEHIGKQKERLGRYLKMEHESELAAHQAADEIKVLKREMLQSIKKRNNLSALPMDTVHFDLEKSRFCEYLAVKVSEGFILLSVAQILIDEVCL